MSRLNSIAELEAKRKAVLDARAAAKPTIFSCGGTGCQALKSKAVVTAFAEELQKQGLSDKVELKITGCRGFCERGPQVVIDPGRILYQRVKAKDVGEIVSETVVKGNIIDRLLFSTVTKADKFTREGDVPFYSKQQRLLLGNSSRIDPRSIED